MTAFKDLLKKVEDSLDAFNKSIGLDKITADLDEVEPILNMGHGEISKVDPVLAQEYSLVLNRYAIYLKKLLNRERTKKIWAENWLHKVVAKMESQYKGPNEYVKQEILYARIINADTAAADLERIINESSLRIQECEGIEEQIQNRYKLFQSIGYKK